MPLGFVYAKHKEIFLVFYLYIIFLIVKLIGFAQVFSERLLRLKFFCYNKIKRKHKKKGGLRYVKIKQEHKTTRENRIGFR